MRLQRKLGKDARRPLVAGSPRSTLSARAGTSLLGFGRMRFRQSGMVAWLRSAGGDHLLARTSSQQAHRIPHPGRCAGFGGNRRQKEASATPASGSVKGPQAEPPVCHEADMTVTTAHIVVTGLCCILTCHAGCTNTRGVRHSFRRGFTRTIPQGSQDQTIRSPLNPSEALGTMRCGNQVLGRSVKHLSSQRAGMTVAAQLVMLARQTMMRAVGAT